MSFQSITGAMTLIQGNTGAPQQFGVASFQPTWTSGDCVIHLGFTAPLVEAAIPLGGLAGTLGRYWFRNTDATNNVTIKHAISGQTILLLRPGEPNMGCFASDVSAPTWIAAGGTPLVEYCICAL